MRTHQQEDYYRGEILGISGGCLDATSYNDMKYLLQRSEGERLYLPIRRLQYLAIVERDEVSFVDIHLRRVVEFSWRDFRPQERDSLSCDVGYEFVWHNQRALELEAEVQRAFAAALSERIKATRKTERDARDLGVLLPFPA
ncbi:hypothetical protein Q4485_10155 [Granulosicoccaceae sp. 1_MG-2023]|nr:hypothetical protein [Granulosicoccaceae sp. 1_MG-2023]